MIPTLRTPRLVLRPFQPRDLDAYAAMCADAEVMRFIGPGGAVDRGGAWRQMALFLGHWQLRGHGMWALERREDGRLVGRAGFLHPEGWPGFELGWLLARDAWGHGYAFEAAAAALAFAHDELGRRDVISLIRPGNDRSARLAAKLGAAHERDVDMMGTAAQLWRHAA